MLADAMVHTLVVAAENHQVLLARKLVGHLLRERLPVGRGEDDLVVVPFGLELLHQGVHRLDHHHHAGVTAETVVVDLAPAAFPIVTDVVDMDFDEPLVAGPFDDGVAERAFQQLRHDSQDIDSHKRCKISEYFQKKTIFASYN